MVEQLTIEKLTAYGFNETFIENLQNREGYECFCHNDKGTFWASNTEQKIYSGIEASRKNYFKGNYIAFPYEDLELVPEYYELRRSRFIAEQRKIAGTIFNENIAKERFRQNEILITEKNIRENEQLRMMPSLAIRAEKLRHYLIWLNELNENVEIRSNTNSPLSPFDNFLNELLKLEVRVTEYYYNDYGYEEDCTPAEFPALKDIPEMNFKIAKYLDLKHYTQAKRDYENKLKELQQLALTYLLNFDESQIKNQLIRLEQLKETIDKCLGHYLEFHNAFINKKNWSIADLEMKIYAGLIVPQHEYGIISERFIFDLHDALMFKDGFLAGFVSQVKRVIGIDEQIEASQAIKDAKTERIRPTISAYALMHVYLALFNGKAVTQQNKNDLAKAYGYKSGEQLRNDFTKYQKEEMRLDLSTDNKRSARTHLERYKTILPLLKAENALAYNKAKEDLQKLEILYSKHH